MNPDDQAAAEYYQQQQEQELRDEELARVVKFIYANIEKWTQHEQEKFICYLRDHSNSITLESDVRDVFARLNHIH